jgi:magnesium-transporting ATPase (P-type)
VTFDSTTKRMTTLHRTPVGSTAYAKGAAEVILGACSGRWTPAGAQPRRICDAAVDAFAARLGLKMPFESKPAMRYTPANLQAAKALITAKLKQ